MAADAIACRRGSFRNARLAQDQAVLHRFCAVNSVQIGIDAAEIDANRGESTTARVANAHGVFESSCMPKEYIRGIDCEAIEVNNGVERKTNTAQDQAVVDRSWRENPWHGLQALADIEFINGSS